MASYNKVILMGNLTRDPELRVTQQGTSVCKLGLAVSRQFKSSDGTSREESVFIDVDAFGKQADTIAKYLSKGRAVLVEGRLRMDQWETQAGEKRTKLGVVLENFQFIGGRSDDGAVSSSVHGHDEASTNISGLGVSAGLVEDLSKKPAIDGGTVPADFVNDEDVPF